MATVASLQVGKVRTLESEGRFWTTATFKEPVVGPVWLSRLGFAGDEQADRKNHGGPDKAALVYSADHYAGWHPDVISQPLPYGAFGENLSVRGMQEADVAVGDIYRLGGATVQVSQPRQPCSKQARRWGVADLVVRINQTGRTGWYLRVLEEGEVQAGDRFELLDRPHPEWPLPLVHEIFHFRKKDLEAARRLAACPALALAWKRELLRRLS
ncbi:MAG: MOSC domain-containing protein [Bryobacteraceae bacterium]|nr:MOSC domain-containing protein [Bryobacteraceae bacterium]MDW8379279.1 MOSC domain-containing protein [Bryobacterales bacterium]